MSCIVLLLCNYIVLTLLSITFLTVLTQLYHAFCCHRIQHCPFLISVSSSTAITSLRQVFHLYVVISGILLLLHRYNAPLTGISLCCIAIVLYVHYISCITVQVSPYSIFYCCNLIISVVLCAYCTARILLLLGAFENYENNISFVISVRPNVRMEQFDSHWTDFDEI